MNKKIITKIEKGRDRHWKNFLDRDYLGGHNLEKDEDMIVTIKKVEGEEQVKNHQTKESSVHIVLYFQEDIPKMILNITNASTISMLYGNHIENWEGKQIQLMTVKVKAFGKEHDALRVRDVVPKKTMTKTQAIALLEKCDNLETLKKTWISLDNKFQNIKEVIDLKESLKTKLQ